MTTGLVKTEIAQEPVTRPQTLISVHVRIKGSMVQLDISIYG